MENSLVSNVQLIDFNEIADHRGKLISLESYKNIPFDIKRIYYLYNTQKDAERGFHAHINLKQVAVCVSGSCTIEVESLSGKDSYSMNTPNQGLFMEGIVWREIKNFSDNCVLIVLADELYQERDYIREYNLFQKHLTKLIPTTKTEFQKW